MLVMVRMPFAFVGTLPTRSAAGLDERLSDRGHEFGLTGQQPTGRDADIAAALAERHATDKRCDLRLPEAGVDAGGARLRTTEARLDARDQRIDVDLDCCRVCLEHLPNVAHECLPLT